MSKPELQEIPEEASKKLILTIASNNQRALVRYIDYLEKEKLEVNEKTLLRFDRKAKERRGNPQIL